MDLSNVRTYTAKETFLVAVSFLCRSKVIEMFLLPIKEHDSNTQVKVNYMKQS